MSAFRLEPMSVGRILDQTFRLYRQHFWRFIAIVAIVQVPVFLLTMTFVDSVTGEVPVYNEAFSGAFTGEAPSGDEPMPPNVGLPFFAGMFLVGLASMLCSAALVKGVSGAYLGQDVSVGQAYRFVLPKLGTILLAGVAVSLVVSIGFLLLIVPGVIFLAWYALTTQVIVIEGTGANAGMSRSKELAGGNKGKILGVLMLAGIIGAIISWAIVLVGGTVVAAAGLSGNDAGNIFTSVFQVVGNIVAAPISAAAVILLYYDLRVRKEGFDLEMLAESLGDQEATPHDLPVGP